MCYLTHRFEKHRKQKTFFFFYCFNWKVVDSEGRLSGIRIFSAKPLFCLNKVVNLNKFDDVFVLFIHLLMKNIKVEISSSLCFPL